MDIIDIRIIDLNNKPIDIKIEEIIDKYKTQVIILGVITGLMYVVKDIKPYDYLKYYCMASISTKTGKLLGEAIKGYLVI